MYSKHAKNLLLAFLVLGMCSTGCGLLGAKAPPDTETNTDTGCLNESKDLIERYKRGDVTESEWKSAFDCVDSSLKFFTDYVRGSTDRAYTQSDMYTFISRFIITNRTVERDLLSGLFDLKTAILGGQSREFTKDEIALFKTLLPKIRDITSALIPALKIGTVQNGNYAPYFEIADAFTRAGDQLADVIQSLPVGSLSRGAIVTLLKQINRNLGLEHAENTAEQVFLGKWILFNSRPDEVEAQDWSMIIRQGMSIAGLGMAILRSTPKDKDGKPEWPSITEDTAFRGFIWETLQRLRPHLTSAVQNHGGSIPFPILDHVIDSMETYLEKEGIKTQAVKDVIRPVLRKLFRSSQKTGLDLAVIETFYNEGAKWIGQMNLLQRVYDFQNLDPLAVSPDLLTQAFDALGATLNGRERDDLRQLKTLLFRFKPEFYRDTRKIYYTPGVEYTKFQHIQVITYYQLVKLAHVPYGSIEEGFTLDDFKVVYQEYISFFYALKMLDPTVIDFPKKVMTYLDIFTPVSNGDMQASFDEAVDFAMMLVSTGTMVKKMREEITARCDQNLGKDILDWKYVAPNCFRSEFFGRFEYWMESFPRMNAYWSGLTTQQKEKSLQWLEHGSRRRGYTDANYGSFDIKAIPAVLHYVESLFTRFDQNTTEILSKQEIFNAFPVFKQLLVRELKKKIPFEINNEYILKGVFSYVVKYQDFLLKPSTMDIANLAWMVGVYRLPTTKVNANRLNVFNIVCNLSAGEDVTPDMSVKVCKP